MIAAFAALFANGRFAVGLGRVLASIVATPFLFIRRAVGAVLGHSSDAEERYRASDQYLLNKGMLVLQAVVIVLAVGMLAAAVVVTWNSWVPPAEVRRAAREYSGEVEAQRQKLGEADAAAAKLDGEWAQREKAIVGAYRQDRQARVDQTAKERRGIEANVRSSRAEYAVSTLQRLTETTTRRSIDSRNDIRRAKRELDWQVSSSWYSLQGWGQTLRRWNELWESGALAQFELSTLSIEELRKADQPAYAETKKVRDHEAERLATMEELLASHREAASLKWKAAFFRALAAFVTFLLFVWLAGALIEGGWMAIRVADDVRRIRQAGPDVATAEPEPAPEVRLVHS